MQPAGLRFW